MPDEGAVQHVNCEVPHGWKGQRNENEWKRVNFCEKNLPRTFYARLISGRNERRGEQEAQRKSGNLGHCLKDPCQYHGSPIAPPLRALEAVQRRATAVFRL